jgi:DNA-binding beta-propeller fold protein YncE
MTTTVPSLPVGRARPRGIVAILVLAALLVGPAAVVLVRSETSAPPSTVVQSLRVAPFPTDVAAAGGRAWVTSAGAGNLVELVDVVDPAAIAVYQVGAGALRVAADASSVWATGAVHDTVTQLAPIAKANAEPVTIGVGGDAVDVAVSQDALWISNGARGSVTRIDPLSRRPIGAPIRTGRFPTAVAVGSAYVWVVNSGDGTVARIDPREHLVVGRRVPVGRDPQDIAIGFGSVWVANRGDGTLTRLSERTGRRQETVRLGGAPSALAVTTEAVLVLDTERARIERLDPRTLRRTNVVNVGGYPAAIAVGDAGSLWVVDARSGTVTRVSRSE